MKLSAYNVRYTRIQNMVKRHRTFGENTQMQPIHWRLLSHTAEFIMKMRKKIKLNYMIMSPLHRVHYTL